MGAAGQGHLRPETFICSGRRTVTPSHRRNVAPYGALCCMSSLVFDYSNPLEQAAPQWRPSGAQLRPSGAPVGPRGALRRDGGGGAGAPSAGNL